MSPFQGRWRLFTNLNFSGILNTLPIAANAVKLYAFFATNVKTGALAIHI
jgi:hypothetical protein